MFSTFFKFELRFWLKGWMVYIFLAVITTLICLATVSDSVQVGSAVENTDRNAPFVIQQFYAILAILTCMMTTAFVNSAASRDFAFNTHQLLFTKPINKFAFLMGRFWGSVLAAVIPMLGISLGIIMAKIWADPDYMGPISWGAHLWGILVFAIPNTIFIGAIVFAIAVWTRSTMASFIGIILLIVAYGVTGQLLNNVENDMLTSLCDPFGPRAFGLATKYWTADQKNTQFLTLVGPMLWNRLVWLGVGMFFLGLGCVRFSFAEKSSKARKRDESLQPVANTAVTLPSVSYTTGLRTQFQQLRSQIRVDFFTTLSSTVFKLVLLAGLVNTVMGLLFARNEGFGIASLPVTYNMVAMIQNTLYIFLLAIITVFAGVLVWKEREAHLDEVYDALPHPTWIVYTGKLISLILLIAAILVAAALAGIAVQMVENYTRFQFDLYAKQLGLDLLAMSGLAVLAMFAHVISPNKYLGYFLFIGLIIADGFGWGLLDIETRMVKFTDPVPSYVYSDMYGFAPFRPIIAWFSAYWAWFYGLISIAAILYWQRGRETSVRQRLAAVRSRWQGGLQIASVVALLGFVGTAGVVFYNTKIVNTFQTSDEQQALQVQYEKDFKAIHENLPQPRVTAVKYKIDIFPERRGLTLSADQILTNDTDEVITQLMVATEDNCEIQMNIERATVQEEYEDFNYFVYKIDPPMQPGENLAMDFTLEFAPKGFENSLSMSQIVQNGTFFNNTICPRIGYQAGYEINDKRQRKKEGLPPPSRMPELEPNNLKARRNTYISNSSDWLDVETIISTSLDQIAVAPGSLLKEWEEDGRRYFHYKVDHPSLNFYSFISADYEVARDKWKDVDVEVYYHHEHQRNVPRMVKSIQDSLEYCSTNFGPYKHKQARIIEFPRVSSFAQAFPGTMPYSESIGFIADIESDDEDDIDMVYYVVAHEMAHQWWAHQVIGANMKGATLLSETLAQYSALMVMEKEYGRNMMRRFLHYERDNYLRSRGRETIGEQPLYKVEGSQGYVHYRKGSVVMYFLKELIGEDKVNKALASIVDRFAYKSAPYPTSVDLINALKEQTPEEHYPLLVDLFEKITIYGNRTLNASYTKTADGKFEVTLEVECRKYHADGNGKESELPFEESVELGAFGIPADGKKWGAVLYRQRVVVKDGKSTHKFIVDAEPHRVGIDPFALLIDRVPDDNLQRPDFIEATTAQK